MPEIISFFTFKASTASLKSALSNALLAPGLLINVASGSYSRIYSRTGPFGPLSLLLEIIAGTLKTLAKSTNAFMPRKYSDKNMSLIPLASPV